MTQLRSGAGTISGQGGKTESAKLGNVKQSSPLKLKCFYPKNKRSLKKKRKKVFAGFGLSFCPKNQRSLKKIFLEGLRRIRSVFCPKNGPGYKSQGGQKSPREGQNISRRDSCPPAPLLPAPMQLRYNIKHSGDCWKILPRMEKQLTYFISVW